MSAPRLTSESAAPNAEVLLEKFYAKNVAEVTIKIRNTRNAVERCFALLSTFDKKVRLKTTELIPDREILHLRRGRGL